MPAPASDTPLPPEDVTLPELVMVQVIPAPPSMPSFPAPLDVTVPVLVMLSGSSAWPRTTGPVLLVLIVLAIGLSWIASA